MGSIGVGFGFEVGAAPSTGVGFGFGKPLREELAGEGVVCAFTTASSRLFLNSSAAFFSCCFCKKNTPPRPRKITTKMVFLITENRGTMNHTLRALDSVFQHRTDNFFRSRAYKVWDCPLLHIFTYKWREPFINLSFH